jgi:pheromone shutdown-related protein TraB
MEESIPHPVEPKIDSPTITELPSTVVTLVSSITGATVHVVGTAHVSRASVVDVCEVIRFTKPNLIFLELCRNRLPLLLTPESDSSGPPLTLAQTLKNASTVGIFSALLAYFYSGVKDKLKITPGAEFRAAYEEAKKLNASVVLGDRPVEITLKRTWANLSFYEKLKFIYTLLKESRLDIKEEDIESMKDTDLITATLKELSKEFPGISRPLIFERDEYLTFMLQNCQAPIVVAVVGLGHVEGIKKCWGKQIDIAALRQIPAVWSFRKVFFSVLAVAVGISSILIYLITSWYSGR